MYAYFFINAMNGIASIILFCNAIYSVNSVVSFHAANGINRNIYHRNTFLKCHSVKEPVTALQVRI